MWPLWLDRIGKILSFAAGFLLAPDLLGRRRLELWQVALARLAQAASAFGSNVVYGLIQVKHFPADEMRQEVGRHIVFSAALSLLSGVAIFGFLMGHGSYRSKWWFMVLVAYIGITIVIALEGELKVKWFLYFAPAAVGIFVGWILVIIPLGGLLYLMAENIVRKLTGRSKLRSALIPLGVLAFITGSLLQLLATFF